MRFDWEESAREAKAFLALIGLLAVLFGITTLYWSTPIPGLIRSVFGY